VNFQASVLDAYREVGPAWSNGPAAAYERMAAAAVATLPSSLAGWLVLDLGAGTGAASRCIARARGRPVALDAAHGMLLQARQDHRPLGGGRLACTVGDAERLPFRDSCFDAVVAAFSLSHVAQPALALAEACRVLRPAGHLISASFRAEPTHPAKAYVDGVAERFGFQVPAWHARLKQLETAVDTSDALLALVATAGLVEPRVDEVRVDTGMNTADELVRWRLGMAHLAPFVAGLPRSQRARLAREAREALGPAAQPWSPTVLMLSSRAPA
jgi:SAM-dependent methyltransferase